MKKKDIDFKYNFKVYWELLRKHKFLFISLLIVLTLIEASYFVDKFIFKVIIDRGTEFVNETLTSSAFTKILLTMAIIFAVIISARVIFKWLHLHLINRLDGEMMVNLKRKFFNHIIRLSYDFHTTHKTGSLISKLARGGRSIEMMTDMMVFNTAPLILQLAMVTGSLLYFSWKPAVVIIVIAIVFISYSWVILQKQRKANVIANKVEDIEKANLSDFLTNIDSIKYFGKENRIISRFRKLTKNTKIAALKHWDYYRWVDAGHSLIIAAGTFFVVLFPLLDFLDGKITLGTLTFVYVVYGNVVFPLFSFVHGLRNFYNAMADFESLFKYGKIRNEIEDKPGAKKMQVKAGSIEFKDVDFAYGKRKLLKKFNLKIPKNKKVAFVGHSGCGKTTLVKLLYRLYDVKGGEILVDGKNIKDFKKESLRSELSIVPQECVLFDDTIYKNIAFSNPNASRDEVIKAIKFAQLDKVIKNFPKQEQTIVGERGVRLSGGEKQRVSIARAILADKKILVLDEATSALDSETEHEIQRDLEKLMRGRTSIIIAHRLSTIMKADIIVVMKKGKIIQKGSHRELIQKEGEYARLWRMQKGGYIK